MDEKLTKAERLRGKKLLTELFKNGRVVKSFPFILLYVPADFPGKTPAQLAISIPKKRVRLAVNRNRIRRQVRETYRKNKHILYDLLKQGNQQYAMLLIFVGNESVLDSNLVQQKITRLLTRLSNDIQQSDLAESHDKEQTH